MTGGSNEGDLINKNLAIAAQTLNLPLAVGSQRAAIESGRTQKIREYAPDAFILGNLGATQVRDYGVKFVRKACESISADAMVIHFNPLQELIQPEGDKNWSGIQPYSWLSLFGIDVLQEQAEDHSYTATTRIY